MEVFLVWHVRHARFTDGRPTEPGFATEPDCFDVETYVLDEDHWVGGFVSIKDDEAKG